MKTNNKIQFDDLDLKCLTEMPLILDVLASTGNKITRIFSPLYTEMNELIKLDLKPNWQIGKKSYECLIFPLTFEEESAKISIKSLETNFGIESAIMVNKMVKGKEVNFFWAYFGYNCFTSEDEIINNFYFTINKGNIRDRFGGAINSLKFYNQMKAKITDYNIEIYHPEKGDDYECIKLLVDDFSVEKVQDGFNVFMKSMLTPFLKSIV